MSLKSLDSLDLKRTEEQILYIISRVKKEFPPLDTKETRSSEPALTEWFSPPPVLDRRLRQNLREATVYQFETLYRKTVWFEVDLKHYTTSFFCRLVPEDLGKSWWNDENLTPQQIFLTAELIGSGVRRILPRYFQDHHLITPGDWEHEASRTVDRLGYPTTSKEALNLVDIIREDNYEWCSTDDYDPRLITAIICLDYVRLRYQYHYIEGGDHKKHTYFPSIDWWRHVLVEIIHQRFRNHHTIEKEERILPSVVASGEAFSLDHLRRLNPGVVEPYVKYNPFDSSTGSKYDPDVKHPVETTFGKELEVHEKTRWKIRRGLVNTWATEGGFKGYDEALKDTAIPYSDGHTQITDRASNLDIDERIAPTFVPDPVLFPDHTDA